MTETSALKRAASEEPDVSSEPSNGVKKAKKVGTTDPTTSTAELESIGATEPASARDEPNDDVALQQKDATSKDIKENGGNEVQQPSKIAPAPVPTEGHDFSEDEKSVSPDGSDEDYDSEEDGDDEPYGHGLERDPDQGGLAMAPLSAEDELAAEIGFARQDDEFDEYVKEHGVKALHGDLASDSDDSEETADRKREELTELENDLDAY
ncbi:hypothetical protein J4E83_008101 [Alternaria metachromatica]|uniref:uncharacterized protein n=1 Tax=Alternaria metachromatica TaxID=283354 RepID=UPI0020C586F0|nr:uncharacterized protein J4E83_008101 [Alternaria metachromatica]KAI4611158.1 hypothetical protein J4E83_008101 [Alternaria metachromatica]